MQTLKLSPHESLEVRRADADALEVEVTYEPGGRKPPAHFHPAQEEHFEVHEGEIHARVDGDDHVLRTGDTFDIPRGAVHQMWNGGDGMARASWTTTPALRTLEWFEHVDRLNRDGRPGPLAFAPLLAQYGDVFRLPGAGGLLARLGRLRGSLPRG